MKLVISTQYHENYGDEINPHWKPKGGSEYIVSVDSNDASIVKEILPFIEYRNEYSEEYALGVSMEADDYESWYEKAQKEDPSEYGIHFEPRLEKVDGVWKKTTKFESSRGSWIRTWDLGIGNETSNFVEKVY